MDGEKRPFIGKAREYFELAANNGSVEAMYNLGVNNLYDTDTMKTFYWLKKSAQLGYGNSMAALAERYSTGSSVSFNVKEANKWISLSIQNKSTYGYYVKGLFFQSEPGANIDSAKYYFEVASKNKFDKTSQHKYYQTLAEKSIQDIEIALVAKIESEKNAKESLKKKKAISTNSKMIACIYCGRAFNITQGYVKNIDECVDSYENAIVRLTFAKIAGEYHYNFILNSMKRGEWFCTRKCVYEYGYCISSGI